MARNYLATVDGGENLAQVGVKLPQPLQAEEKPRGDKNKGDGYIRIVGAAAGAATEDRTAWRKAGGRLEGEEVEVMIVATPRAMAVRH
jgi:hypothetical protein